MFELAAVGMAQADPHTGKFIRVNAKFCQITGYSEHELLEMRISELNHPEDRHLDRPGFERLISGEITNYSLEKRYVRKDGRTIWVEVNVAAIRDDKPLRTIAVIKDITESKRAQMTLQAVIDSLPVALWAVDKSGEILLSRGSGVAALGFKEHELVGKNQFEVFGPDTPASQNVRRALSGDAFHDEFKVGARDIETYFAPSRDAEGNVTGMVGISLDATERKQTEREYREIFNLPTHLIAVIGTDGCFHKTNPAQTHLLGWNLEEMLGKPVAGFVHPEDAERTQAEMGKLFSGVPIILDFRNRCLHREGGYRWISWSGTAREGKIYCIGSDITQRIAAEEALLVSESRYRRIYDANIVGVLHWDYSGKITDANDRFLEMIGYSRHELRTGKIRWDELTPPEYHGLDAQALEEIKVRGAAPMFEKEYIRKDGARVPVLIAGANYNNVAQGGIAVVLDISNLKRVQQELSKAVSARDEFVSIASHELKTPLTTLTLQAQSRQRNLQRGRTELFSAEKLAKMLDDDRRQLARLNHLIDDMLDMSRISAGRLNINRKVCDLSAITRETVARLSAQLEAAGNLATLVVPDDMPVSIDAYRIEQVLVNILTNAIRYAPASKIEIGLMKEDDHAVLRVRDHGPGIAPEHHDRIFQRFERAISVNEVSGLGLGLFISREIVERHGGKLTLESSPGNGAAFFIRLPVSDAETAPISAS